MKTWQIRGALIGKFYEQGKLQITSHRFRACKTKKLKITKHNPKNKQQPQKQTTTLKPNTKQTKQ
ncbi:hypothetical protein HpNP49_11790 [Helicobacter pylori]